MSILEKHSGFKFKGKISYCMVELIHGYTDSDTVPPFCPTSLQFQMDWDSVFLISHRYFVNKSYNVSHMRHNLHTLSSTESLYWVYGQSAIIIILPNRSKLTLSSPYMRTGSFSCYVTRRESSARSMTSDPVFIPCLHSFYWCALVHNITHAFICVWLL